MAKKIIQLLFFLGLGIFFVWFSVKDLQPEDVQIIKDSATGVLNPKSMFFIFISVVCGAIAHYFRALRNILLINPLGYRVRKTTAFYSVMLCYLSNLAIPRIGEVLRCTFLQRYDQVPFQKSLGTVVVERVFDMFIFVLFFVLVIILNTGLLSDLVINKEENITLGASIAEKWTTLWALKYYLLIALLVVLFATIFIVKYIRKTREQTVQKQSKTIGKIKNIIVGLWQGLISVKDLKHPYLFVFYTFAIWLFYYLGTMLCFYAFDFLQHLGPMPAFVVLAVGSIGFILAQGGLGLYPLIVAGILALYGVNYAQGLAAGWIGWSAQTIMILIVGFTTLILSSFLKIENRAGE
ncbi:MAG: flippase-like domain-containing protein [Lentimicrobiaceae bacterium]|nr:flippase-like domain-containing protein [Lentimicrobiaceae bacterium]